MIPDNHAKSYLSKSYINAVATQAGFTCQFSDPDYGTDAQISEVQCLASGMLVATGYHFDVQVKASHRFTVDGSSVRYPMEADAFNRLVSHPGGLIALVLYCIPEDPAERLLLTEEFLQLRKCCYWQLIGSTPTTNTATTTITIPRAQLFDPVACTHLMERAKLGNPAT